MAAVDPRSVTEVDAQIGVRIRARRQEIGLSQVDVANAVGVAFQQMQKYEIGENRVSAAMLMRIAQVLGVEPAQLLPGAPVRRSRAKADSADAMAQQLQHAFSCIRSKRERRLVLQLARQFASEAADKARRKGRS